jgi:hypothetical protein
VTKTQIFSASGSSSIKIYSTTDAEYPIAQMLDAHKLGCHHVSTSENGIRAATAGFGGEVKIWTLQGKGQDSIWVEEGKIVGEIDVCIGLAGVLLIAFGLRCRWQPSRRNLGNSSLS